MNTGWWTLSWGHLVSAKRLAECETLPRGYGVAWMLPYQDAFYCLPIPLNIIMRHFRAWWLRARLPMEGGDPSGDAYTYGYSRGRHDGYDSGMQQGIRLTQIANRYEN